MGKSATDTRAVINGDKKENSLLLIMERHFFLIKGQFPQLQKQREHNSPFNKST